MKADAAGWWSAARLQIAGDSYGYIVDGEGPFPDPRSGSQPSGVHELSCIVDHAAFDWTDEGWRPPPLASTVLYELHVGTFTRGGTFESAIERLDHLGDLGVTHVELMPVAEFPGVRGWGYDSVNLFAPHHTYGGPSGLKRLIDACHRRGLAVILDVVYNHLGPEGNYLSRFGPYFTSRHKTPWGDAINLDDAGSDEVRRLLCDNAIMWLRDYHADGLRLDAVHAFIDASATHFLEQLTTEVDRLEASLARSCVLIGESDLNDPRLITAIDGGGYGLDAQWSDDFHHALHAALTGERSGYYEDFGSLEHVARAIEQGFVYTGSHSHYRRRRHGREPHGIPGWRFVVAAQTHDQIGNRARGDRLSHLISPDRLRIAAALLLTAPFVPMLFQGEEWGATTPFVYFTALEDDALAALVRDGRRREFATFGWRADDIPDPQDIETFAQSLLRWEELSQWPHDDLLQWHRALIALRRQRPSLTDGNYEACRVQFDPEGAWIIVRRSELAVVCNLSPRPCEIPLAGARRRIVLASSRAAAELRSDGVWLLPESVAIVEADSAPLAPTAQSADATSRRTPATHAFSAS